MTTLKATRTQDLSHAEIARMLTRRYQALTEADPENVGTRINHLKTPLTEAARRLRKTK